MTKPRIKYPKKVYLLWYDSIYEDCGLKKVFVTLREATYYKETLSDKRKYSIEAYDVSHYPEEER